MKALPQLAMEHDRLDQVAPPLVPEGYHMQALGEGDVEGLAELYERCHVGWGTVEKTQGAIRKHLLFTPQRVVIVEHENRVVASGTVAQDERDASTSVMHLIGVLPEYRGKNLGRVVCEQVMRVAHQEGFKRQRLTTDDDRLAAIGLYLRLGFRPLWEHASHPPRWRRVFKKLHLRDGHPQAIHRGTWSLGHRLMNEGRLFLSDWRALLLRR
jgi:mycothiol synthase